METIFGIILFGIIFLIGIGIVLMLAETEEGGL